MNKLIIDNNTSIDEFIIDKDLDLTINLKEISKNLTIHVMSNVCLRVFDISKETASSITFNIYDNSQVLINKFSIDCSDEITININDENSKITFNSSIINYKDNEYKQTINHNYKNSESKITNHCLNIADNKFKLIVNGVIKKDSIDTVFKQDNRIINLKNGNSLILPNLIVDNNDIEASHSAYIGTFDEDIIFYIMTRGVTEKEANNLLIKAFLINDMNLEQKEEDILNAIVESI